jgi:voltage-gated sodium channel
MTELTAVRTGAGRLALRCRAVNEAPLFAFTVLTVILLNAVLLGVETYPGLSTTYSRLLDGAELACLVVFTLEMLVRLGAHLDRPGAFFRDPWNIFDLLVVSSAFIPFLRENSTLLRLLRLARVLRTARFMPQLRVLLVAVGRSLPGTASFLVVGALVLYVYSMVGWICFAPYDPEHYGSLGRAALTLFLLMTLDGLGDSVRAGLEISPLSIVFYASYVLFGSFVLVNVLIGVVLNALDEARAMEAADAAEAARPAVEAAVPDPADELRLRITAVRQALDDMETQIGTPLWPPRPEHTHAHSG